jgi:hypothetical protein
MSRRKRKPFAAGLPPAPGQGCPIAVPLTLDLLEATLSPADLRTVAALLNGPAPRFRRTFAARPGAANVRVVTVWADGDLTGVEIYPLSEVQP